MTYELFEPRKALAHVMAEPSPMSLVDKLLDEETVHVSPELPLGFTLHVSIRPIPQPIMLAGTTLVEGTTYDIVLKSRGRGKGQTLRGWTYIGRRYGEVAQFQLRKGDHAWGVIRMLHPRWDADRIVSVTPS